ncbi:MAG: ESX secretion-associated protein EspG, partial [Actinomycetota bacterium]|nr:ESX secretion-associated protein EspG [Actinomycetota bacterium]
MTVWRLSAPQWDVLTEVACLQERYPSPIEVRAHGRTNLERARIREQVRAELEQAGLLHTGRIDADLENALRVLHRPVMWLDSVWLPDAATNQPVRVLAARSGSTAVCAQQRPPEPGATLLEVIPPGTLAAAVVGRLPALPPGRKPAVTVPLTLPATRRDDGSVLVQASAGHGERERQADEAILTAPHPRAGQIAANVRHTSGAVRRSAVLRWCD